MGRRVTLAGVHTHTHTHTHTSSLINKKINNIKIKDSKMLVSILDAS